MNLGFLTYLQLVFYVVLGIAILMGFLRGMKKTLFTLITMVIFYVVFFVTVVPVSKMLWSMQMPWLGGMLGNIDASLASFTSFEDSFQSILQVILGDSVDIANVSAEFLTLATGIGQFVMKIVYTILYFTVILLIYKLICMILSAIILGKKTKGEAKNGGFGALFGALNGIVAIFVMLIMMGGIMSVVESMATLVPSGSEETTPLTFESRFRTYEASNPIIILAYPTPEDSSDTEAMMEDLQAMVDAYNRNPFVKLAALIEAPSVVNPDTKVPLHINLFDRVLSFEYNGNTIAFRYELSILAEAAQVFITSDYAETNNLADITGAEIRSVFTTLGKSNLIISLLPLAIEIGADYFDTDLPISSEDLYLIDLEEELPLLGAISGALFDIFNGAEMIAGEGSEEDVVIDAAFIRTLFQDMSESQLLVLIVESLLVPMLEGQDPEAPAIIKVPSGIDWEVELLALGEVVAEIYEQDIAFDDLLGGDPVLLLNALASIDVDVLLDSKLISSTLINILSKDAGVEALDFLSIPDDVVWLDDDNNGELRNILVAFSAILNATDSLDIDNFGISTITALSDSAIDKLFDSIVLSATISDMLLDQDFGGNSIVIPDALYDDQGFIMSTELKALAKAMVLILDEEQVDETAFDFTKVLAMSASDIGKLLNSEIMQATVSEVLLASPTLDESALPGSGVLIIPTYYREAIVVDGTSKQQIEKTELIHLLISLNLLEITDFDNGMDADAIETIFLDSVDRNTFLESGSMHITTDNMIRGNTNISVSIPALAKSTAYNIANVTTKQEIIDFVLAANAMASSDFTSVNFSFAAILALTPSEQDVILNSMIVRNEITADVVTACLLPKSLVPFVGPFAPVIDNTNYEENDLANFLTKATIEAVIVYYS